MQSTEVASEHWKQPVDIVNIEQLLWKSLKVTRSCASGLKATLKISTAPAATRSAPGTAISAQCGLKDMEPVEPVYLAQTKATFWECHRLSREKSKQIIGISLKYAEQGGISGRGLPTWSCTRTIGINKLRTTLQRLVLRSAGRVLRASACILHHSPSLRTKNMKSKPLQVLCKYVANRLNSLWGSCIWSHW